MIPVATLTHQKPARWDCARGLAWPDHAFLWRDCALALPLWEGGGRRIWDLVTGFEGVFDPNQTDTDWVASEWGHALNFDGGSADEVIWADPPSNYWDGFSIFTVAVLFRTANVTGVKGLFGKYSPATDKRAWRLYLDADELELQVSNDGAGNEVQQSTDANLVANTWYLAHVVFNAGTFKVYVGGKAKAVDANFTTHTSVFAGTHTVELGNREDGQGLVGDIAGAWLWTRELALWEIERHTEDPFGMFEVGLVLPSWAVLHSGGAAAGPWVSAGLVPKGQQTKLITGLVNGVSYDVKAETLDNFGNRSAGSTPVAGTPVAGATPFRGVRGVITPAKARPRVRPGAWREARRRGRR